MSANEEIASDAKYITVRIEEAKCCKRCECWRKPISGLGTKFLMLPVAGIDEL